MAKRPRPDMDQVREAMRGRDQREEEEQPPPPPREEPAPDEAEDEGD